MNEKLFRSGLRFVLAAVVVAVLAVVDIFIQRFVATSNNDAAFLLQAFVLTQFTLLGIWLVTDNGVWSIRFFSVVLAGWLLEFGTVQFTTIRPGLSLLLLSHIFVLTPLLVALRCLSTFPWHRTVDGNIKRRVPQFTIRDALLFVAAIAWLLLLGRWLLAERSSVVQSLVLDPLSNIFMLFLFATWTALVAVLSLWLVLTPKKMFAGIALAVIIVTSGITVGAFRLTEIWVACAFGGLQSGILISALSVGHHFRLPISQRLAHRLVG